MSEWLLKKWTNLALWSHDGLERVEDLNNKQHLQLGESSRSKKLSRLFLGHFWTKIRSDNCFEIVLIYRMA